MGLPYTQVHSNTHYTWYGIGGQHRKDRTPCQTDVRTTDPISLQRHPQSHSLSFLVEPKSLCRWPFFVCRNLGKCVLHCLIRCLLGCPRKIQKRLEKVREREREVKRWDFFGISRRRRRQCSHACITSFAMEHSLFDKSHSSPLSLVFFLLFCCRSENTRVGKRRRGKSR